MSYSERSADILVKRALATEMREELRTNPESVLNRLANEVTNEQPRALETDKWVYRGVILTLALISLSVVAHVMWLSINHPDGTNMKVPDLLTALGSACIGALAGILSPKP